MATATKGLSEMTSEELYARAKSLRAQFRAAPRGSAVWSNLVYLISEVYREQRRRKGD